MQSSSTTPDQVCGACVSFEPARHEPVPPKYGYCKLREQLEREQHGRPAGRLVDTGTRCFMSRCFMSRWHAGQPLPSFEAREGRA